MKNESKGLGDTVAKITKATGIDKIVKFVAGEDCGCEERKEKLNKLFPYAQPKCLSEDEYKILDNYFVKNTDTVTGEEQANFVQINNRVFSQQQTTSTCVSCVRDLVSKLKTIYNEYNQDPNA